MELSGMRDGAMKSVTVPESGTVGTYATGSSRKWKRVVLSIEDKLKNLICDLAESGRCWSTIRHTNEHYCSFLSETARKRLQTFEQTKISD